MQSLVTVPTVVEGLEALGVRPGATLLVHCSLSRFGHVQGGAQTVIEGLVRTVGSTGTLVMPAFSPGRFDPSEWRNPPVPESLWDRIRFETPAFHPQKTPVDHTMSCVYELFRTWPGAQRSAHPHSSFAAWGQHRDEVLNEHNLADRFGESSPLRRLYDLDAQVLFLGTGYDTCTCFHLAEYRQPDPPMRSYFMVDRGGEQPVLGRYEDLDTNSSVFEALGMEFEARNAPAQHVIGEALCRLFSLRQAVEFAVSWLSSARH